MTDRIEEITQKIYREGVTRAENDAQQIIHEARQNAKEIIKQGQMDRDQIIRRAQQEADELKKTTEAELQLAAKQFISKLKQKITTIITTSQGQDTVKKSLDEIKFMQDILLTLLSNWSQNTSGSLDLEVLLPKDQQKELTTFFSTRGKEIMDRGIEFGLDEKIDRGFKIRPKDGRYIILFTDKDFENYFTRYFKEKTKHLLFGSDKQH